MSSVFLGSGSVILPGPYVSGEPKDSAKPSRMQPFYSCETCDVIPPLFAPVLLKGVGEKAQAGPGTNKAATKAATKYGAGLVV